MEGVNSGTLERDRRGRPRERRRTVLALVAHDAKKQDLLRLVRSHRTYLTGIDLMATGTTGGLIAGELGLVVERMASGPAGGDLQIGARIAQGAVDALIFLRDPLTAHPHEPDIQALLKVCDVRQVPAATNLASGDILLHAMAGGRMGSWRDDRSAGGGPGGAALPSPGEEAIRRRHPVAGSRRLLRPVPDQDRPGGA